MQCRVVFNVKYECTTSVNKLIKHALLNNKINNNTKILTLLNSRIRKQDLCFGFWVIQKCDWTVKFEKKAFLRLATFDIFLFNKKFYQIEIISMMSSFIDI